MHENTVETGDKPTGMGWHTLMDRGVDKNTVGEIIKRHHDRKRRATELREVRRASGR